MLGYRYSEKKEVEIYEPEAMWIRKIYAMYISNYSVSQIYDFLEKNKVKTTTGNDKWNNSCIRLILKNEKYVGDCLMQKSYIEDFKTHRLVTNKGEKQKYLIQNGHPAIVDRETWDKAQQILVERREHYKMPLGTSPNFRMPSPTAYAGFVYCPYCKSYYRIRTQRYNGQPTKKVLVCASNVQSKLCKNDNIFVDVLNDSIMKELSILKDNIQPLKKAMLEAFSDNGGIDRENLIEALEAKIKALREKLKKLNDMHTEYGYELSKEIESKITNLTKDKMRIQSELLVTESAEARASNIIRKLKDINANPESIDDVDFKSVFSRVIVKNKAEILFVIGNPEVVRSVVKDKGTFGSKVDYRVRKTTYSMHFGLIINR